MIVIFFRDRSEIAPHIWKTLTVSSVEEIGRERGKTCINIKFPFHILLMPNYATSGTQFNKIFVQDSVENLLEGILLGMP